MLAMNLIACCVLKIADIVFKAIILTLNPLHQTGMMRVHIFKQINKGYNTKSLMIILILSKRKCEQ